MSDEETREGHRGDESPTRSWAERRSGGAAAKELIGNYRLLQRLGEGGMGEVWEAQQEKPVRRRVALKLVKRGMDTAEFLARFESERQALALMDHPAIARVFDGGATEHGRPYFVMEFVKGMPLTHYCDEHRLTTRERLELFVEICSGVQHAHQKGIVHRDLKPSNILVMIRDQEQAPKIIDFGVAKAIDQPLTEDALFTRLGQWVGTPDYMSPEQTGVGGLDIDTRSDVYSLGVVLYELLIGTRPLETSSAHVSGYDEVRRVIREVEPPTPSAKLMGMGVDAAAVAERRRTDVSSLSRRLRGDLDWISMKALEKDRRRRYQTASELALEIERHLRDEPVLARPPSLTYRVQKMARRHRVGVVFVHYDGGPPVDLCRGHGLSGAENDSGARSCQP